MSRWSPPPLSAADIADVDGGCYESFPCQHMVTFHGGRSPALVSGVRLWTCMLEADFCAPWCTPWLAEHLGVYYGAHENRERAAQYVEATLAGEIKEKPFAQCRPFNAPGKATVALGPQTTARCVLGERRRNIVVAANTPVPLAAGRVIRVGCVAPLGADYCHGAVLRVDGVDLVPVERAGDVQATMPLSGDIRIAAPAGCATRFRITCIEGEMYTRSMDRDGRLFGVMRCRDAVDVPPGLAAIEISFERNGATQHGRPYVAYGGDNVEIARVDDVRLLPSPWQVPGAVASDMAGLTAVPVSAARRIEFPGDFDLVVARFINLKRDDSPGTATAGSCPRPPSPQ